MAYRSSISFNSITRSFSSLGNGLNSARKTIVNISRSVGRDNENKKRSISRDSLLFQRKRENVRRKKQRSLLELSGVGAAFRSPTKVIQNTSRSIFGRIMSFAGTIMAGWLIYNLPTIIGMAQELIARIKRLTSILVSFIPNTARILNEFKDLFGAYATNFISFDFFDTSGRVKKEMDELSQAFMDMNGSFEEALKLITTPLTEGIESGQDIPPLGTDYSQGQGPSTLPAQDSPEMYRIAAALATEGASGQSAADMMQVVVNRKATGRYGKTFTDILAAPGQFEGVAKKGTSAFKKIQTLDQASKWSGVSKDTLLKYIKDIQNPSLQASAAKHVGGALEFRAAPQYYLKYGLVKGEMGSDGRFYGSSWRGSPGDNQFLKDPSRGDPVRPEGAAPFNLPAPVPPTSRSTPTPPQPTGRLIPQTGPGGFIQGGSGAKGETTYATHFHIDLKNASYTAEGLAKIREVAFRAVKAMQARGSTVYLTNYSQRTPASKNDSTLRSQILIDQQKHDERSTPGIDIQEHNPSIQRTFPSQPGSATKFPFAVGSVYWRGGYGREAEIIGSGGVTVSHGAPGSSESKVQAAPASIAPAARPSVPEPTSTLPLKVSSISKPMNQTVALAPERKGQTIVVAPQQQPQIIAAASQQQSSQPSNTSQTPLNNNMLNRLLTELAYT